MSKTKVGLVLGSFLAFFHLVWALLVLFGIAQPLLDFIYNIHMIYNPFLVAPFSFGRAILLIVVTFMVGFVFGFVIAYIWKKFSKPSQIASNQGYQVPGQN